MLLRSLQAKLTGDWDDPARTRADRAGWAIGQLGDAALPALPELTRLARDPSRTTRATRAIETMAYCIGAPAVPALGKRSDQRPAL